MNSCYSNWANVVSGISQGSILGPLLFISYATKLPEKEEKSEMLKTN